MKNGKFETKKEASDHAIAMVADSWLTWAEKVIARGDKPGKFSDCGKSIVLGEMDKPVYDRVRRFMDGESIFLNARREILGKLRMGFNTSVAKHFGVVAFNQEPEPPSELDPNPNDTPEQAALRMAMDQMGHSECCSFRSHFRPLNYIPMKHRRIWNAKRSKLMADAPPCDCWRAVAGNLLGVDPIKAR